MLGILYSVGVVARAVYTIDMYKSTYEHCVPHPHHLHHITSRDASGHSAQPRFPRGLCVVRKPDRLIPPMEDGKLGLEEDVSIHLKSITGLQATKAI